MAITHEQLQHRIALRDAHVANIAVTFYDYDVIGLECSHPTCRTPDSNKVMGYQTLFIVEDIYGWNIERIGAAIEKHLSDLGFGLLPRMAS